MKRKVVLATILVLGSILLSGCVEQSNTNGEYAVTDIRIGDAPTDEFDHINITFSEVRLHSNETGWITETIDAENGTLDLIDLHLNEITGSLTIMDLPLANYTKLWIVIDSATGILKDDSTEINLTVPSGILKIQQLFKLDDGDNIITVDIDLNASILKYKGGEEYKILPVLAGLSHQHKNEMRFKEQDKTKLKNMVENTKPVISILVDGNLTKHLTVNEGEDILFNATGTIDVDGDNLTYFWDFGDGNSSDEIIVSHNYTKNKAYQVTLTVTDDKGNSDTEKITITVKSNGN
jgi:hypothetical protein